MSSVLIVGIVVGMFIYTRQVPNSEFSRIPEVDLEDVDTTVPK
jgi:hypothetical protein